MNYKDVKLGMKVVFVKGKYEGQVAEINDIAGCIFGVLENGLEIEIHEDFIEEYKAVVKFYSSEASTGAKRKLYGHTSNGRSYLVVLDRGGLLEVVPYMDGYIRANGKMRFH